MNNDVEESYSDSIDSYCEEMVLKENDAPATSKHNRRAVYVHFAHEEVVPKVVADGFLRPDFAVNGFGAYAFRLDSWDDCSYCSSEMLARYNRAVFFMTDYLPTRGGHAGAGETLWRHNVLFTWVKVAGGRAGYKRLVAAYWKANEAKSRERWRQEQMAESIRSPVLDPEPDPKKVYFKVATASQAEKVLQENSLLVHPIQAHRSNMDDGFGVFATRLEHADQLFELHRLRKRNGRVILFKTNCLPAQGWGWDYRNSIWRHDLPLSWVQVVNDKTAAKLAIEQLSLRKD